MLPLIDGSFALVAAVGVALCGLGAVIHRRRDQLGDSGLAAYAVVFGLGGVVVAALGLVFGPADTPVQPTWAAAGFLFWAVAAVPWFLFTVQYTGRYTDIDYRTVAILYLPFVGVLTNFGIDSQVGNIVTSVVFIYCLSLVLVGIALLAYSTWSYVRLSLRQAVALSVLPLATMLSVNFTSLLRQIDLAVAVVAFAGSYTVGAALFGWVVLSTPFLSWTPAVETVGRRAFLSETDDLLVVVDGTDTVIECNDTATETLRTPPVPGRSLSSSLGRGSDALAGSETVTLDTEDGRRRYDPQVSPVTDGGAELGAVCSLRDVTDRELREERLAVLNRVLRHNLRNTVDVIKSHAEAVKGDHGAAIADAADDVTELGSRARRIDRFVAERPDTERVDVVAVVESVLDGVDADGVTVTTDLPDSATVRTNRPALEAAVESALGNAVKYAESAVEVSVGTDGRHCTVVVADDGPGIPDDELDAIDSGTETPLRHGTGLGLWQLTWAVRTMGGELSFDTDGGTTVTFTVRDRQ
jgi:signal transduction histidine kinase